MNDFDRSDASEFIKCFSALVWSRLSRDGTKILSPQLCWRRSQAKLSYERHMGPILRTGCIGRINASCTTPGASDLRKQDVPCNNADRVRVPETLRQN